MVVEIEKLFTKDRFLSGPSLLLLILYAPLGIVLLILRIFISLQLCLASLILPTGTFVRKVVLRVLYSVMGIVIRETECQMKDEKCRIIVSNHITPFDHLAISLVCPCMTVSVYNMPAPLSSILCFRDLGITSGREVLRSNIEAYLNQPNSLPLLLHPESETTNGLVALMKYGSWALEIDESVLVLGLKVKRLPVLPIAPSVLGGSWIADLFYILFSPVTIFTIRYIGKMTKQGAESEDNFALRIQNATASALNLQASSHTVHDKVEYMKRLAREEAAASNPFFSPEIHTMALQVREVLPYLPLDIIKRDLIRTRNVDMTITNFLEGNIPEPYPTAVLDSPNLNFISSLNTSNSSPQYNSDNSSQSRRLDNPMELSMSAKAFGKSACERMQSYQERKSQLIEMARQKYIEKHGLKIPGVNC